MPIAPRAARARVAAGCQIRRLPPQASAPTALAARRHGRDIYDSATGGISRRPADRGAERQPAGIRQAGLELSGQRCRPGPRRGRAAVACWRAMATCWPASKRASGVPKEILVAIWGMETDYGQAMGNFNLFAALATLAYDGPRLDFAKPELFAAMKIYQQQHYPRADDRDLGRRLRPDPVHAVHLSRICHRWRWRRQIDLWHSPADALASAAKLLHGAGWQTGQPWGMK